MEENYITAGEFAKLSRTTKRTITFYDEKGLLKPVKLNDKGYRYYKTDQILDFQVISLLIRLNFSLDEIKSYLDNNATLESLFFEKRGDIQKEVRTLQASLYALDEYYENIKKLGFLLNLKLKQ